MRKRAIASLVIAFFCFGTAQAQNLPDQKETLKTIVKVNDYFMKKYKDYRTPMALYSIQLYNGSSTNICRYLYPVNNVS